MYKNWYIRLIYNKDQRALITNGVSLRLWRGTVINRGFLGYNRLCFNYISHSLAWLGLSLFIDSKSHWACISFHFKIYDSRLSRPQSRSTNNDSGISDLYSGETRLLKHFSKMYILLMHPRTWLLLLYIYIVRVLIAVVNCPTRPSPCCMHERTHSLALFDKSLQLARADW